MTTSNTLGFPILTIMLFLPAAAGLLFVLVPGRSMASGHAGRAADRARVWDAFTFGALAVTLVDFALSLVVLLNFRSGAVLGSGPSGVAWHLQFFERAPWVGSLGINYFVAVDGINVWLLPLVTFLTAMCVFGGAMMIHRRTRAFMALLLIAETGVLGVLLTWNVFLLYVFWEVMLIPTYFLIGLWGESRRVYATMKFVIYTLLGSFLMLVAIFYLYANAFQHNLDVDNLVMHPLSNGQQTWLFLAFMLAFAIKVPLWPFHTWAPDAYLEAPVPVTVLLSSVLSKTGAFGIIRFCLPIFPHAARQFSTLLVVLAIIGLLYTALIALVQVDIKRTMAYASVSHMNIILLGIFVLNAQGIDGSILQMVNHGMIMAGVFFMIAMVYARSGTRRLTEMGGMARAFPILAAFLLFMFLASMDLPGLGSFTGEFTILIGVFLANAWWAAVAALVTIIAAWYTVRWFQGVMHGPWRPPVGDDQDTSAAGAAPGDSATTVYEYPVRRPRIVRDLRPLEMALVIPVAAVVIWLGVQSKPVTDRTEPTVSQLTYVVHQGPPTGLSSAAPASGNISGPLAAEVGPASATTTSTIVHVRREAHLLGGHGVLARRTSSRRGW